MSNKSIHYITGGMVLQAPAVQKTAQTSSNFNRKTSGGQGAPFGDEVLVMEAMKMELTLRAPRAGRIDSVQAATGDFVEADAVLVRLAAA